MGIFSWIQAKDYNYDSMVFVLVWMWSGPQIFKLLLPCWVTTHAHLCSKINWYFGFGTSYQLYFTFVIAYLVVIFPCILIEIVSSLLQETFEIILWGNAMNLSSKHAMLWIASFKIRIKIHQCDSLRIALRTRPLSSSRQPVDLGPKISPVKFKQRP